MRTGVSGAHEMPESFVNRLVSLVGVCVMAARQNAQTFAQHSGQQEVTVNEVALGQKLAAYHLLSSSNLENDVSNMERLLCSPEDADVPSTAPSVNASDMSTVQSHGCCECHTCTGMSTIDAVWRRWRPTDEAEIFLKAQTEKIVDRMLTRK